MRLLRPRDVPGMQMARLGRDRDGGYVVPLRAMAQAGACLSFGVGDDTSFEEQLVAAFPGVRVILFDHTVPQPPSSAATFEFVRQGVCAADTQWIRNSFGQIRGCRMFGRGVLIGRDGPFIRVDRRYSVETHMRRRSVLGRPVVVKLDVEGAEYDIIVATPTTVWRDVLCLVVELHHLDGLGSIRRAVGCLKHLSQTHELVHLHGNNNRPLVSAPLGLSYPEVVELTFVNKRVAPRSTPSTRDFPGELDRPGQTDRPELDLSFISSSLLASAATTLDEASCSP